MKYCPQFSDSDCGVAALAMVLGEEYVLVRALVRAMFPWAATDRRGLTVRELEAVAQALGATTERRRKYDLSADSGILSVRWDPRGWHFAVLRWGLVFDTDFCVVPADRYLDDLRVPNPRFGGLLVVTR